MASTSSVWVLWMERISSWNICLLSSISLWALDYSREYHYLRWSSIAFWGPTYTIVITMLLYIVTWYLNICNCIIETSVAKFLELSINSVVFLVGGFLESEGNKQQGNPPNWNSSKQDNKTTIATLVDIKSFPNLRAMLPIWPLYHWFSHFKGFFCCWCN